MTSLAAHHPALLNTPLRFYTPGQVALATFIGSPIAGAWLLALNYQRFDERVAARNAIICGAIATAALFAVAAFLPERFPSAAIPMGYTFGMLYGARAWQGERIHAVLKSGAVRASSWKASGVGVACLAAVFVVFATGLLLFEASATRVEFPPNDEIYALGDATELDARELGAFLTEREYFGHQGASVYLDVEPERVTVEFVYLGDASSVDVQSVFREMQRDLGERMFNGTPVEIRLIDAAGRTNTTLEPPAML